MGFVAWPGTQTRDTSQRGDHISWRPELKSWAAHRQDVLLDGRKVRHCGGASVIRELDERRGFADVARHPLGGAAVAAGVELPLGLVVDVRHRRRDLWAASGDGSHTSLPTVALRKEVCEP